MTRVLAVDAYFYNAIEWRYDLLLIQCNDFNYCELPVSGTHHFAFWAISYFVFTMSAHCYKQYRSVLYLHLWLSILFPTLVDKNSGLYVAKERSTATWYYTSIHVFNHSNIIFVFLTALGISNFLPGVRGLNNQTRQHLEEAIRFAKRWSVCFPLTFSMIHAAYQHY